MTARPFALFLGLFAWLYGVAVVLAAFLIESVPNGLALVGFIIAFLGGPLFRYAWRRPA